MTEIAEPKIIPKIKPKTNLTEPVDYNVIYINDDITTEEFVIESLVIVFNYPQPQAEEMTNKIHTEGSAVVATLPYEMAEQKGVEVSMLARNNGYPLVVKLEASR